MRGVHSYLILLALIAGSAYLVFSPGNHQPAEAVADLSIGEPIVFENLTIFPVSSLTPRLSDRFITLDEGLRAGTVEIVERGATADRRANLNDDPFAASAAAQSATITDPFAAPPQPAEPNAGSPSSVAQGEPTDPFAAPPAPNAAPNNDSQLSELPTLHASPGNSVNELMVINRSDRPLYLMPGEVIVGGSQDRTIGEELVIAPSSEPTPISVYCVEHGRWGGREQAEYVRLAARIDTDNDGQSSSIDAFAGNLSLVLDPTDLTQKANAGKFIASAGSLNKDVRLAVQAGEGQGKVWEEVAAQNTKANVQTDSGTFVSNYSNDQAAKRLEPYLERLHAPVLKTGNVVGVIVAVNGKIESMDVFESTPLFKKLWPKLLKSYALDAAAEPGQATAKPANLSDAKRFLALVAGVKRDRHAAKGELTVSRGDTDDVLLFTAHERKGKKASPATVNAHGVIGGLGGAIHGSAFSK